MPPSDACPYGQVILLRSYVFAFGKSDVSLCEVNVPAAQLYM